MNIIFPCDYFNKRKPDEQFLDQWNAFRNVGISCHTIDTENLTSASIQPAIPEGSLVIYRGYMLEIDQYSALYNCVCEGKSLMLSRPDHYSLCHHIPNWYPLIKDLTPETLFFSDVESAARAMEKLEWPGFFIKDYVKSLKTSIGSKITDRNQLATVVEEMKKFRGRIEGGLSIRRLEQLQPETEQRVFVLRGHPYMRDGSSAPAIVNEVSKKIDAPFFSIDIISNEQGALRVVEIGDGQVSDTVGWNADDFVRIFEHVV